MVLIMSYQIRKKSDVTYITFPLFEKLGVVHGFSTKEGGVSKGCYQSMNLSFSRGDDRDCVAKNHRKFAEAVGYDVESLVFSDQVHDTKIRRVTKDDCGKGIFRERDYQGIDGLMTNDPAVTLITFYADCIPLFFCDPVEKVVAMAHSGWRGTVGKIGEKMVDKLQQEFSCKKENIFVAIGPGICKDCYEVSEDVILKFQQEFSQKNWEKLYTAKGNHKYQLDLWKANEILLTESGILPEHIEVSGLCTACHSDLLFSHRVNGDKRGNLAGVISGEGL